MGNNVLEWHKILDFKELISAEEELKRKAGIYVWGWFDEEDNFVPYYVGKANNLRQRLFDHIGKLKGGMYSIYEWKYAFSKDFHPLKEIEEDKLIYVPSSIENWYNVFLSNKVQKSMNYLINNLMFSWCETDKDVNINLEKYIFQLINKNSHEYYGNYKTGASVRGQNYLPMNNFTFTGDKTMVRLCKSF